MQREIGRPGVKPVTQDSDFRAWLTMKRQPDNASGHDSLREVLKTIEQSESNKWFLMPLVRHLKRIVTGPEPKSVKPLRWWHVLISYMLMTVIFAFFDWRDDRIAVDGSDIGRILGIPALIHVFCLSFFAHRFFVGPRRKWCVILQVIVGQLTTWAAYYWLMAPPDIVVVDGSRYLIYEERSQRLYPVSKERFEDWEGDKLIRGLEDDETPREAWAFKPVSDKPPPSLFASLIPPSFEQSEGTGTSITPIRLLIAFRVCAVLWIVYIHAALLISELFDTTRVVKWLALITSFSFATAIGLCFLVPESSSEVFTASIQGAVALSMLFNLLFHGIKDQQFLSRLRRTMNVIWSAAAIVILSVVGFAMYGIFPDFRAFVDAHWYLIPAIVLVAVGCLVLEIALAVSMNARLHLRVAEFRDKIGLLIVATILMGITVVVWTRGGLLPGMLMLGVTILGIWRNWVTNRRQAHPLD